MDNKSQILILKDLTSGYNGNDVIHKINLEINRGEIILLIGQNGAGKTTLIKTIMGLLKVKEGSIEYDGVQLNDIPTYQRVNMGISCKMQQTDIFSNMSVLDNLKLSARMNGNWFKEKTDDIYATFPNLFKLRNQSVGVLSGGEQQMLAISMTLLQNPKIIFFDEPLVGLDEAKIKLFLNKVQQLKELSNITSVIVEHGVKEIGNIADRILGVNSGEICFNQECQRCDNAVIKAINFLLRRI